MRTPFNVISVLLLTAAVFIIAISNVSARKKIYYVDTEHINLTSWNKKYFSYFNMSSHRNSRSDPIHYMNFHFDVFVPLNKEIFVDLFVYEFLSNEYRRGFIELHLNLCNLIRNDTFIGPLLSSIKSCPSPKGEYHLVNVSVSDQPLLRTFPLNKGRVYFNITRGKLRERMAEAFVDAAIKYRWSQ